MMHDEFIKIARLEEQGIELAKSDYNKIEKVYLYHPYFADKSKQEIAAAFNAGGMGLMEALLPVAERIEMAEATIAASKAEYDRQLRRLLDYDEETKAIAEERQAGRRELLASVKAAESKHEYNQGSTETEKNQELVKFLRWAKMVEVAIKEAKKN